MILYHQTFGILHGTKQTLLIFRKKKADVFISYQFSLGEKVYFFFPKASCIFPEKIIVHLNNSFTS